MAHRVVEPIVPLLLTTRITRRAGRLDFQEFVQMALELNLAPKAK